MPWSYLLVAIARDLMRPLCRDDVLGLFFFQAEDGIRDDLVTGVQTCDLPIWLRLRDAAEAPPSNFALVRSGTGIGVGLVLGGEVYRGTGGGEGLAGEFGHMTIVAGGKQCRDRKSTRLNSSHQIISYGVFCLKKKVVHGRVADAHSGEGTAARGDAAGARSVARAVEHDPPIRVEGDVLTWHGTASDLSQSAAA